MRLLTQSHFRKWPKPGFCYLCGKTLQSAHPTNADHCPPEGMFSPSDRVNYPIKLKVHAACNHNWHVRDEKLAIFFDILHGRTKVNDPALQGKLTFLDIHTEQGLYQGLANFPLKELNARIVRCMHALMYHEFLPPLPLSTVHYPWPQADAKKPDRVFPHLPQTYAFAKALCTAQKTFTFDEVRAYNGAFRYVCTWTRADHGEPMCLFSYDIYRLDRFAVRIDGFPRAVIGMYVSDIPNSASQCSRLLVDHADHELLYPLLETAQQADAAGRPQAAGG